MGERKYPVYIVYNPVTDVIAEWDPFFPRLLFEDETASGWFVSANKLRRMGFIKVCEL